jgi:hypothetical protein
LVFFPFAFLFFLLFSPFFFHLVSAAALKHICTELVVVHQLCLFFFSFFVIPFLLLFYVFGHVDFTFPFPVGPADKTSANNQPLPYGMFGSGERGGGGAAILLPCVSRA